MANTTIYPYGQNGSLPSEDIIEIDPIFTNSPAYNITAANISTWNGKQDVISDLSTIRSGASAGATAYQKPSSGIPASDIASGVIPDISGKANTTDLATVATSGSYNDLSDTPTIPAEVTESTISGWGFTKNTGTLTSETDPTVPSWAKEASKPTYTASEVGALPDTTIIPTVPTTVSSFTNDINYVKYVLCADETAYNAISSKDSGTLYLIPKT